MNDRLRTACVAHGARALALSVALFVTWGCKSTGDNDQAECELGEVSQRPCGTLNQGIQMMICQEYQWVQDGECLDDSKCFGDDERAKACGINRRGQQWQQCVAGQWEIEDMCYDGDVCIDGTEKFGVCGTRNQGRVSLVCGRGQWLQYSANCDENVSCTSGQTETIACGINWEGTIDLSCENGKWVAQGECVDTDVCDNQEEATFSCGEEGRGFLDHTCLQGQWVPNHGAICLLPRSCVDGDDNEETCGLNNRGLMRQYCDDGQYGEWEACDDPDECEDSDEPQWLLCGDDDSGLREEVLCIDGQFDRMCAQRAAAIYPGAGGVRIVRPEPHSEGTHEVLATGNNASQQLGLGENHPAQNTGLISASAYPLPTAIPKPEHAVTDEVRRGKIFGASRTHECAVVQGKLFCWGDNTHGQLSYDPQELSQSAVPLEVTIDASSTIFESVALGEGFTCALTSDSDVYCWGLNDEGQLGDSTDQTVFTPKRVDVDDVNAIAAGDAHVCVLASVLDFDFPADQLFCWGRNNERQAGFEAEDDVFREPVMHDGFSYFEMEPPIWYWDESYEGYFEDRNAVIDVYAAGNYTLVLAMGIWERFDTVTHELLQRDLAVQLLGIGYGLNPILGLDETDEGTQWPTWMLEWRSDEWQEVLRDVYVSRTNICVDAAVQGQDVECIGDNQYGQISPQYNDHVSTFSSLTPYGVLHSIAVLDHAICGVGGSGVTVCAGANTHGQLGNGTFDRDQTDGFEDMLHWSEQ